MKHTLTILALLCIGLTATAQTGLYKRYADRAGVQAYCVEKYPLVGGDSVCVTLLQTDDTAVYRALLAELHSLPYTPKHLHFKGTVTDVSHESNTSPKADALAMRLRERKHLVVFSADGLPGDRGHYAIYCPSDRMVVLAFLVGSDAESLKVAGHMMSTEFETKK